ncbi:MAG: agmatine deiminase family protein [Acidobacteriota bacterium]|nr:agmatine deiminase family protein [Acidobacteriota bacterium]
MRLPAEWEPHDATWLAWPHEATDWPGKFAAIPWVYAEIVRRLTAVEKVCILVANSAAELKARRVLRKCAADLSQVEFFLCPTDRSWTRDYCPLFVHADSGQLIATDWIFNGWAKYDNHHLDNSIPELVADQLQMARIETGVVLEGGSIDANGAGTLLTTEECLLSPVQARNPHLNRDQLEHVFATHLGISRTIWLGQGIAGDDTHGHVDDIARFVNENTIVAAVEEDRSEANYAPLQDNLHRLRRTGFHIAELPMPSPVYFDGQRLPASYANFYIANGLVLVPTFNDPKDRVALDILAGLFPARQIIGMAATDLVLGLGTLHCMTLQQPAPALHSSSVRDNV